MKFSYRWLSDRADLSGLAAEDVAQALTRVGMAVELVEEHQRADGELDHVFEVEVTTNRVDAMNHLGLAREAAVALERQLTPGDPGPAGDPGKAGDLGATVEVSCPELCSRFTARVIEGVTVGPSPGWLVEYLEAIGLRSINNVVDITNFILQDQGQPQHAYDLATLAEKRLIVRRAEAGEKLTTLDGQERTLEEGQCLICDPKGAVGIGGVMGGLETEVTEKTKTVLLESAWFDPVSVRKTSRAVGLHTDASHRFERGVDWSAALSANDRACQMIVDLCGGEILPGVIDLRAEEFLPQPSPIDVRTGQISRFAGTEINHDNAVRWLSALGFNVEAGADDQITVTPPSWRTEDVERSADVYEEVIRVFGFDNVPAELPAIAGSDAPETEMQQLLRRLRDRLVAAGYLEAIDWSFHDDATDQAFGALPLGDGANQPVRLVNPLSELYNVMRRSLLPGLVASARFNQRRGAEAVRLFEVGHIFGRYGKAPEGARAEVEVEALGWIGGGNDPSPWQRKSAYDFFDARGVLDALFDVIRLPFEVRPGEFAGMVAGTVAEVYVEGEKVGVLGQIDDGDETYAYPVFAAELLIEPLVRASDSLGLRVDAPSRYPSIEADLTLTHAHEVSWNQITAAIEGQEAAGKLPGLEAFWLRDRYQGKGVPDGAVNSTLSFRYGSTERSLTQDEVNEQHEALRGALQEAFGWG